MTKKEIDELREKNECGAIGRGEIVDLLDEIERLRNPSEGDQQSQAAAWTAVWKELEFAGMLFHVDPKYDGTGRQRAINFIRHLAKSATSHATD